MTKYNIRNLKVASFYHNILQKREGETLPKLFFIYKQLDKCQNEYYPNNLNLISFCRRISLHVLLFSTNSDHIENDKIMREKLGNLS